MEEGMFFFNDQNEKHLINHRELPRTVPQLCRMGLVRINI